MDYLFTNEEYMNKNSILLFCYIHCILLFVIYPKKESVSTFNFLGANLFSCHSIYCCKNHPVILIGPEIK